MSKEAALAFLQKVSEDADLQQKLVAFAADQGYEFTVDEMNDADLDVVAGGVTTQPPQMASNIMKTKHDTAKNAINNVR